LVPAQALLLNEKTGEGAVMVKLAMVSQVINGVELLTTNL
jgi:hypothetical protein